MSAIDTGISGNEFAQTEFLPQHSPQYQEERRSEVLAYLKRDPELMKIPVIMLTSTDDQNEINRAYEMGANGYVVKPVSVESFIDRVVKLGMFIEIIEFAENANLRP